MGPRKDKDSQAVERQSLAASADNGVTPEMDAEDEITPLRQ